MRVLALKSSFVLVEWINILSELTLNGRVIGEVEAESNIVQFLASTLKECAGEYLRLSIIFIKFTQPI